ncbi:iron-enterobactin ABC transporter permease [Kocuria coralli]|uniref:Iron-enterobactin ABC transporter permease n=2 Tax=Kocuria coralli TaxID=1461025 RepID=A0A5J5KWG3_9MICC|nr:iron-enterobactin ABC transporter permease [Kocuria coralli]
MRQRREGPEGGPGARRAVVDFGTPTLELTTRRLSSRIGVRSLTVTLVMAAIAVMIVIAMMAIGDFPLTIPDVLAALAGTGDEFHRVIVIEWRLPIALAALVFGALLGLGGAIFQSLTRNPLGSPDIIGFDAGSFTAVLVTMLVFGTRNYWTVATAAIVGGIVVAAVVYLLAFRGGIQGFRLIIVGIGVAAMLGSVNSYLITRANLQDAIAVGFWSAGTLSRTSWSNLVPAMLLAAVVVLGSALLASGLRQLELGDDGARAHGVALNRDRLLLMVLGVMTTAIVTAAAGPIGFIALAAPQLARRVAGTAGVGLASSAAMGALLLSAAHAIAVLSAMWFLPIPVGLVTVCIGGTYFIILLIREARRHL